MCKQKAVTIVSLIITIAGYCFADYSIVKTPTCMEIADYACTDDYIWYAASYGDRRYTGIGRLHVPSQKGMFFTGNELGRPLTSFPCRIVVVDSAFAAFLLGATIYYYDGTKWNLTSSSSDKYINLLAIPSTGKLWMLSSYSIVTMDKNGKTDTIPKDSIGLSDPLISFAKDISEKVWVISTNQIACYDNSSWKVMAHNDSMNFSRIDITLDGKICFLSNGRYYSLLDDYLDTLPLPVHVRSSNSNVDERGNQWNHLDSALDVSLQMVTADKKSITFQNAKSSGWKNWPEFMRSTPDSAIRIWKKDVYYRYFNGFYHYSGDTTNFYWEWLPVNTSIARLDTIDADKLLPSRDSSMYLVSLKASSSFLINDIIKVKSNQFQILPPVKMVNSTDIYEDRNGTLWAVGNRVYKFENSVWTRVTIPGIMSFGKVAEDNQGRVLLFENLIIGDSSGNNENIRAILRQSGSDWEIINETNANLPPGFGGFVQDPKGTYWVATSSGIFKSKDIYQWTRDDSASFSFSGNITDFIINSKGNIVVAVKANGQSDAGSAVLQFDGTRWQNLGLPFDSISSVKLSEDKNGRLWCGNLSYDPVLSYYDSEGWHKVEDISIEDIAIRELKTDPFNQLWIRAFNGHVFKYTPGNTNPAVKRMYPNTQCQHFNISSAGLGIATIRYIVSNPTNISIEMYDLQGKSVQIIKNGFHDKGSYQLHWNYKNAKGVYLIRMITPNSVYSAPFRSF